MAIAKFRYKDDSPPENAGLLSYNHWDYKREEIDYNKAVFNLKQGFIVGFGEGCEYNLFKMFENEICSFAITPKYLFTNVMVELPNLDNVKYYLYEYKS